MSLIDLLPPIPSSVHPAPPSPTTTTTPPVATPPISGSPDPFGNITANIAAWLAQQLGQGAANVVGGAVNGIQSAAGNVLGAADKELVRLLIFGALIMVIFIALFALVVPKDTGSDIANYAVQAAKSKGSGGGGSVEAEAAEAVA